MEGPRVTLKVVYLATALSLAAFVGGFAMAGALTISQGSPESANGNFESTSSISWWSQSSVGLSATPGPLPTSLAGSTAASPVVLGSGASQSFLLNAGTAGDVAHYFKMAETTSAPTSTELEIVFTVSTQTVPVVTTLTVFLETQSSSISTAVTLTLYYDLGSAASGSVVLNSVQQISQQCGSVGSCP